MKKAIIALITLLSVSIFVNSCDQYDDTEIRSRIDALEKTTIASINQQIESIKSSLTTLEGVDAEIKEAINYFQAKDGDYTKEINALKEEGGFLSTRITALRQYIDSTLLGERDWAKATFSTLEQYNATCDTLTKIQTSITDLDGTLRKAISDAISESESSIKKWVNEQLTGYWTIAETQARLDTLKNTEDKEIKDLREELAKVKQELSDGYTKAISDAITNSEGKLSKTIEDVNIALENKIIALDKRVAALEEKLNNILREFNITFDDDEMGILTGSSTVVGYTITGATDNTIVKAFGQNGWSAKVTPDGTSKGKITVNAPSPVTDDEIIVLVYDGEFRTIMRTINFVTGVVTPSVEAKELEAGAGTVDITVTSNMAYKVSVPNNVDWLSFIGTKSSKTETLSFSYKSNEGGVRKVVVSFLDASDKVISTMSFIQQGTATNVTLTEAGTLLALIGGEDLIQSIKGLVISGPINGTDILMIRRMTQLQFLDLEDAIIVEGGVPYYDQQVTHENEIGDFMFIRLNSLVNVVLPYTATAIGENAFYECENLESVKMFDNVKTMDSRSFSILPKMSSINLSSNITEIPEHCFSSCALKEISLPPGLVAIRRMSFLSSGIRSITIPETVTTIELDAFYASGLEEIHIKGTPETLSSVSESAFVGLYDKAVLYIPQGTKEDFFLTFFGNFKTIIEE